MLIFIAGGYILFTMRDGYGATDPDFALFDVRVQVLKFNLKNFQTFIFPLFSKQTSKLQDLVLERKWELLVGPVFFDNFENEKPGRFYMLRKCHRLGNNF